MKKKNWRLWRRTVFSRDTCWWPTRHHYLSKPGGGGGGLGGVAYKDRARPPPPWNAANCTRPLRTTNPPPAAAVALSGHQLHLDLLPRGGHDRGVPLVPLPLGAAAPAARPPVEGRGALHRVLVVELAGDLQHPAGLDGDGVEVRDEVLLAGTAGQDRRGGRGKRGVAGMHWKRGGGVPLPPLHGPPAYAQPLSPCRHVPA